MTKLLYGLKYIYLKKGKHIALRKYRQDNFNNMDQLLFFVMSNKYYIYKSRNNCLKPISKSVVQVISTSLYKYMQLVVWLLFGHQDIVPVNITTFNTFSEHITAVI